jgi:hypothetical protein
MRFSGADAFRDRNDLAQPIKPAEFSATLANYSLSDVNRQDN